MRIRKGNQVEVWTQDAASPVGAWRVGEVTWGNGHSYTLRWHDGGEVSGRISRKSVRPRPPPAPVPRDLDAGDMVEVFDDDDCLWKCAEVQGAAADGDRRFKLKIVGAAKVLTVPPQRLRMRQVLRDDDVWVKLHKDNQIAVPSAMPFHTNGVSVGMGTGKGKGGYEPMRPGFTPLLQKRSFGMLGSTSNTIINGNRFEDTTKRFCAKEEPRYEAEVIVPNVFLNKQDEMSNEYCDVVGAGSNSDVDQQQHIENEVDIEGSDSESASSSDGSSSSSSNSDSRTRSMESSEDCAAARASRPCNDQKVDQLQPREKEHCGSKAESREIECKTLNDQKATVQEHIHRLELEAYQNLMKAFHACGKVLSWQKMELLSDLRVHLHITNDEHLQVLNVILNRKGRFAGSQF
ncbi:hypothetical protein SEVIR_5G230500v4 [Setaria viridis]|uniref:ENT domain-containing protein n=1 Tax=Setaria viridis TaxID=4556 RepID=A0A4U6UJU4_SETVI|nr:uncharacterized protein LOC117855179 [Setaria viridis]XP_034593364.1 uncharacterized protein LOC117855179 [Setaria viridis]TKW15325.1 hypothetical protein SEVIR_5G230500v2 [Setaria viridis]TKW15326.1 hypothetical protein SEVIR_5G230500v2 [Setaria viridis]TKW15327.1 hypothetical protein SEVIR_5G230500v2 [Setaria viridis]